MPYHAGSAIICAILLLAVLSLAGTAGGTDFFNLPAPPPPDQYGNILIDRISTKNGVKPVSFSHRIHRMRYTCRVCHAELEFNMKTGSTEISESSSRSGRFCGACHNGKIAFKHNGNCDRCHNGDREAGEDKFAALERLPFPRTFFGDGINWVEAVKQGKITPLNHLKVKSTSIPFEKTLLLEAEWSIIPPVIFPHKEHTAWIDCDGCHPDPFNIKRKTTPHFSMSAIMRGEFCGACHLNVAFPMNDCKRCHPGMKDDKNTPGL